MSRPDIEAIRARAEAATPGPWEWQGGYGDSWLGRSGCRSWDEQRDGYVLSDGSASGEYPPRIDAFGPDAAFIAHAREDIPALLAYIAELEARLR